MKAIILAGGKGTRLQPLTFDIPKALVPVQRRTLTEHVFDIFRKYGIKDIILSVGYKRKMMKEFFEDGKVFKLNITYIEEEQPLGTAGPFIVMNEQGKKIDETFFVVNGDNLFDINLKNMLAFHIANKATVTIALSKVEDPSSFGVAVLEGNKIVDFVEKPKEPPSNYINSGYYIMEPEVFDIVKGKKNAMIENDIFPKLAKEGKLYGYRSEGKWFDTGTPERLEKVEKEWKLS